MNTKRAARGFSLMNKSLQKCIFLSRLNYDAWNHKSTHEWSKRIIFVNSTSKTWEKRSNWNKMQNCCLAGDGFGESARPTEYPTYQSRCEKISKPPKRNIKTDEKKYQNRWKELSKQTKTKSSKMNKALVTNNHLRCRDLFRS